MDSVTGAAQFVKFSLTAEQVIEIIKVSADKGATSLKLGDLHIAFEVKPKESKQNQSEIVLSQAEHDAQTQNAVVQAELDTKEDQIDNMLIEDPARAERLIAMGDLNNVGTDGTDDDGDDS